MICLFFSENVFESTLLAVGYFVGRKKPNMDICRHRDIILWNIGLYAVSTFHTTPCNNSN